MARMETLSLEIPNIDDGALPLGANMTVQTSLCTHMQDFEKNAWKVRDMKIRCALLFPNLGSTEYVCVCSLLNNLPRCTYV